MAELSQQTRKLIQRYQDWHQSLQPKKGVPTLHVDEVASKVAIFYEKIRGIIDWKEEHLLRRRAIERIIKRRLFSRINLENGKFTGKGIAEPLVLELIRGGHFPNDKIEETKIPEVQKSLDKYIFILNNSPHSSEKSKLRLYGWLSSICACEIEEILESSIKERALIDYMFGIMKERIVLNEGILKIKGISEKEKNTQIYIAVQRALFKLDSPVITYHLLKYKFPNWRNPSPELLNNLAKNIYSLIKELEKELNHRLADKFYHICEKYDTPFLLLGDIISEEPFSISEKISNPEKLETLIKKAYQKRLKTLKARLGRAAFYSTLSIFLTNIVSLLAIEIPATKILTGHFNFLAIGVDILGPTFLMFFLVITIKPPKKGNLERVIMETIKIAYQKENKDIYEIRTFSKGNIILRFLATVLYIIFFLIIVGVIFWFLYQIKFPPLSYMIFLVFLSLIAFAGAKIRQRAKELQVIEEKEGLFHFIVDPFAIPLIQLGKWLTVKWKRYNVIAAIFSALIDLPFLVFVEFLEQWRYFLKEKKEEIH